MHPLAQIGLLLAAAAVAAAAAYAAYLAWRVDSRQERMEDVLWMIDRRMQLEELDSSTRPATGERFKPPSAPRPPGSRVG